MHDHVPADLDHRSTRGLFQAMLLTGSFMLVEAVGGWLAGSLALLADAGHMLTDTSALALAWFAMRLAERPSDRLRSYGYHRFQVLAAFVNGLVLIAVVGWIVIEAVQRLAAPAPILGLPMLLVAVTGLAVNVLALLLLRRGDRENLNVQGALLHVLGDLLGSLAVIVAAVVVLTTGWVPIDPLLSLLVAVLILNSAWRLVRKSAHILLEGTPDWLDIEEVRRCLREEIAAVEDVHHVHVWSLTSQRPLVTLHARLAPGADFSVALTSINQLLAERFGLTHSTIQLEPDVCVEGLHQHGPSPQDVATDDRRG